MGNMNVCHEQTVAANLGLATERGTTIDGDAFAQRCTVANDGKGGFTRVFEILWLGTDHGTGVDHTIGTYSRTVGHNDVAFEDGTVADLNIRFDDAKRTNRNARTKLGCGVYDSCGMNNDVAIGH
jgi:hypothetical protein